jgi:Na+-driven multidrug efflux pump
VKDRKTTNPDMDENHHDGINGCNRNGSNKNNDDRNPREILLSYNESHAIECSPTVVAGTKAESHDVEKTQYNDQSDCPTTNFYSSITPSSKFSDTDIDRSKSHSTLLTTKTMPMICKEMQQLLHIAIPSIGIQWNMLFVYQQGATYVGSILLNDNDALGGYSLGTLIANMTYLSIVVGALSASDSIMPSLFQKKHYHEMSYVMIRGVIVCFFFLIPVIFFFKQSNMIRYVLVHIFHQNEPSSALAAQWIKYYVWGMIPNLLYRTITQWLVSQKKPFPSIYVTLIPTYVINPYLLHHWILDYGVVGSSMAISMTQWLVFISLLFYLLIFPSTYIHDTFPKVSPRTIHHVIFVDTISMKQYISLSVGGIVAQSEWWFWETMCFIAGSFGVVSLCAHTIAYNLVPLSFMIPLGISIGLTNRMGMILTKSHSSTIEPSTSHPSAAVQLASLVMIFTMLFGTAIVGLLWKYQMFVICLFTHDSDVIYETQRIWPMVCFHIWILHVFGINGGILRGTLLYQSKYHYTSEEPKTPMKTDLTFVFHEILPIFFHFTLLSMFFLRCTRTLTYCSPRNTMASRKSCFNHFVVCRIAKCHLLGYL